MEKIKDAFELLTILAKTLVKLFNALGLSTNEEAKGGNDYYVYLDEVHDGVETVLNSGILDKYID